ncbi:hypothetical protein BG006_006979 [Podila minutissima]|uniref:Uncharacterized protein n=1 Tax=Podila minutissima TaxID=64525 RepID=A0A9P5VKZ7_9FUNG|nr:hypothetical protein BG006_006979 [Podila minutissima]
MAKRDPKSPQPSSETSTTQGHVKEHDNRDAMSVVSAGQKNKSWAKSLKKATNSILYMAMPPNSAEQLPMVVAQTPMSPDRLPSVPSIALLPSGPLYTDVSSPSSTFTPTLTAGPIPSGYTLPPPVPAPQTHSKFVPISTSTPALSVASSIAASSSSSKANVSKEVRSRRSTSSSTSGHPKPSSTTSSTHSNVRPSSKGKERSQSVPMPVKDTVPTSDEEYTEISVVSRSVTTISHLAPSKTNCPSAMNTTLKAALGPQEEDLIETLPSRPPSPQHAIEKNEAQERPSEEPFVLVRSEDRSNHISLEEPVATSESKTLPLLPISFSSFDISLETAIMEPLVLKRDESTQEGGPQKGYTVLTIDTRISTTPTTASDSQSTQTFTTAETSIPPTSPTSSSSPTSPTSPSMTVASEQKQKRRSMVVEVSGFPAIPAKSMSLARSLSRSRASALAGPPRPNPVRNAPWIWHQDGFYHQRLESHQILSKEQVFEQFHLDLEQEGPNGFFLFKLVKKFKRQDSSLLGISSSLLDAEISASPTSTSPAGSPMTPTSILDSIDAISVSQRLKRQLLLQKRKKQRKMSSGASESEEDDNLEALLTMSNNNSSLQNLNSSLQEVIDAVDSLRETSDWTGLLDQPHEYSHAKYQEQQRVLKKQEVKQHAPDSDNEYTSKDKDAMDVDALERRKGVYATGRLDGMNLMSKKRLKALGRKSSTSTARKNSSSNGSNANGSESTTAQDGASTSKKGTSSSTMESADPAFKKQAICQLHIYSRNGLKFKFDVMQDNELHFVEASKKYTFMDPLAAHRQPDLDVSSPKNGIVGGDDSLSPLPVLTHPTSMPIPHLPSPDSNSSRSVARRSNSTRSRNTVSSVVSSSTAAGSGGNRRVFVTRLGRHTLLTYTEYKILAKSASSFTLGAKLLIQRSLAVATGSSGSSSSKDNNHNDTNNSSLMIGSPTRASFASPTSPLTATPASQASSSSETSDYFSAKKKSRSIPGFASKAVAAIKTPSTPGTPSASGPKTPRPIVTPYKPAEYKSNTLRVSISTPTTSGGTPDESTATSSPYTPLSEQTRTSSSPSDIPRSDSLSSSHQDYSNLASSPLATSYLSSSPPTLPPTPGTSSFATNTSSTSTSTSYISPIKRQGNQAGLKFQHLFATVHQRLQKLELDNGVSFYSSSLVQWTVIEDPDELRWWRDKIGIQMIGRLPGDPLPVSMTRNSIATFAAHGTGAVRQSYLSMSTISDASSMGPARPFKSTVSVERLGYRFLRVSGHMGTLKVTVSEQVEARAVALAVRAELLKQQQQQQPAKMAYPPVGGPSSSLLEQVWIEIDESVSENDDDDEVEKVQFDSDSESDEDEEEVLRGKTFYDVYEYDEWTGRTRMKKTPSTDRFSRRERHDRTFAQRQQQQKNGGAKDGDKRERQQQPLIERMTMIVGQAKVFKGDWYMKNIYRYDLK